MTIEAVLKQIASSLNAVIPLLILLATAIFLWGIVKYITAGGNEEDVKKARELVVYGIIGLAVMVAVWGFVDIVLDFFFGNTAIPKIPGGDIVDTL